MSCTAIIQARMDSSRLPGKILKPLAGKPVLFHVVDRLKYSRKLDRIIVATTTESEDNPVEVFCRDNHISICRGSRTDVLDRFYKTAKQFNANPIVRITADCPVIDPVIVDEVISGFLDNNFDFYGLAGEFPDGLDCTVFNFSTLEMTWKHAELPSEREHVCPYMEKHPEIFKQGGYEPFRDLQHMRWTLDEPADYRFLGVIFDRLYCPNKPFLTRDILELLEQEPEISSINSSIIRNEGYLRSLERDQVSTAEKTDSSVTDE